jgi:hypothetical protein
MTKQVTRDIDPSQARDLLERAPRACLAFTGEHGPQVEPVALTWADGRCRVRLSGGSLPAAGQEVVLLVDEGIHYFDLRAIYLRGVVQPLAAAVGDKEAAAWFELTPTKTVAWDYGTLREVA